MRELKRDETSLEVRLDEAVRNAEDVRALGIEVGDFVSIDPRTTNIDWAAFREGQREPATEAVGSALVLDEIARREDIGVSENEIDAELGKYASRSGMTVDAVRERLDEEGGLARVAAGIRREKALERVMSQARIIEM